MHELSTLSGWVTCTSHTCFPSHPGLQPVKLERAEERWPHTLHVTAECIWLSRRKGRPDDTGHRCCLGCLPAWKVWSLWVAGHSSALLWTSVAVVGGVLSGLDPLQCSCLENPRDGGTWWASVYGVAQSQTRLKRLSIRLSKAPGTSPVVEWLRLHAPNAGSYSDFKFSSPFSTLT